MLCTSTYHSPFSRYQHFSRLFQKYEGNIVSKLRLKEDKTTINIPWFAFR